MLLVCVLVVVSFFLWENKNFGRGSEMNSNWSYYFLYFIRERMSVQYSSHDHLKLHFKN